MFEHIVQMGPMLVLAGLMAGWVAEVVSRADGHGFIRDMVVAQRRFWGSSLTT